MNAPTPPRPKPATESHLDDELSIEWLRRIEDVCSKFENLPASQRRIDTHLEGFSGAAKERLTQELIAVDRELRQREGLPEDESRYQAYGHDSSRDLPGSNSARPASETEVELPTSKRFEFLQRIGSGGIGQVWRVFDHEALRPLAIKTLHTHLNEEPLAHERFRREAILTGTLQHPGIPPIYDRGNLEDETPFFSMKLVEGQTLAEILRHRQTPAAARSNLIQVFQSIAQTVAYAHNRKVIHRDLKPHNIMVGAFGEVQVMDWGLAKRLGDRDLVETESKQPTDPDADTDHGTSVAPIAKPNGSRYVSDSTPFNSHLTTSGDVVGTLGYMSPEQARGDIDAVGPRADVFSLGVILFQIICDRPVFDSRKRNILLQQTCDGDVSRAMECLETSDASPDLIKLCRECLNPDPKERLADAGVVAMAVSEFLSGFERRLRQAEVDRASAVVRSQEIRKRQTWTLGLGSLVAIIGVLTLIFIANQLVKTRALAQSEREARTRAEIEAETTGEINTFLETVLASGLPEHQGPDVKLIEVLDDLIPQLDGKLRDRPQVEARIRHTAGASYRWLDDLDASEKQLRLALDAYERAGMGKTMSALLTQDRLAGTLRSRDEGNDIREAITIRKHVLRETEAILGPNNIETIRSMNNLALTMVEGGQLDEGEAILLDAISRGKQCAAFDETDRIGMVLNLGDLESKRESWDKAESLYKEVLSSPDADIDTLSNALLQFGMMCDELDQYAEAAEYYRKAFESRSEYLGKESFLTLSAWRKRTRSLTKAKLHEQALEAALESERLHIKADWWFASGTVLEARLLQAENLAALNRVDEAKRSLEETVSRFKENRGTDHEYTLAAVKQLEELMSSE
ncbi:MAG: serine/threonine-protein kinase [Planctomycetota bacterium]